MERELIDTLKEVITESNDKTIEIRPANNSNGLGKLWLLAFIGGAIAGGYWLGKSQRSTDKLQSVANETADRTKRVTDQVANKIQEGGETVAERVEEGSEHASEKVQETGEEVAEGAEETGEMITEMEDEIDQS